MEVVNKAEADHYGRKQTQPDISTAMNGIQAIEKQAHLIDTRL